MLLLSASCDSSADGLGQSVDPTCRRGRRTSRVARDGDDHALQEDRDVSLSLPKFLKT